MDREEMPFNRAERSWVYRSAKGEDTMVAFGSTRDMRPVGSVIFVNCPLSDPGAGRRGYDRRDHRPLLRQALHDLFRFQHLGDELRGDL